MSPTPPAAPGLVAPAYDNGTLSDLLPSALAALAAADPGTNVLDLPAASRYVVVVVDGLGRRLLGRCSGDAPYLASLADRCRPMTAGVPSTTATSLVSLGTGLPPGAHGVVGYTSLVPGTRDLLYPLKWNTDVPPREWQPHPTVFERAVQAGVQVTSVGRKSLRGTGLTVAGLRGGAYVEGDSVGVRVAAAAEASAIGRSTLVYVYDGDLDWTGHQVGCRSRAWREQLAVVDTFCERLRLALPDDAVLVVTGDHGMVDVSREARVDVDAEPELRAGVEIVGGEARLRHLYTRDGAAEEVAATWRERLGDRAVVATRGEAIEAGWFGPVEDRVAPRLGDVLVACGADLAVECTGTFPVERELVGLHGSLTPEEMEIPLLVDFGP